MSSRRPPPVVAIRTLASILPFAGMLSGRCSAAVGQSFTRAPATAHLPVPLAQPLRDGGQIRRVVDPQALERQNRGRRNRLNDGPAADVALVVDETYGSVADSRDDAGIDRVSLYRMRADLIEDAGIERRRRNNAPRGNGRERYGAQTIRNIGGIIGGRQALRSGRRVLHVVPEMDLRRRSRIEEILAYENEPLPTATVRRPPIQVSDDVDARRASHAHAAVDMGSLLSEAVYVVVQEFDDVALRHSRAALVRGREDVAQDQHGTDRIADEQIIGMQALGAAAELQPLGNQGTFYPHAIHQSVDADVFIDAPSDRNVAHHDIVDVVIARLAAVDRDPISVVGEPWDRSKSGIDRDMLDHHIRSVNLERRAAQHDAGARRGLAGNRDLTMVDRKIRSQIYIACHVEHDDAWPRRLEGRAQGSGTGIGK